MIRFKLSYNNEKEAAWLNRMAERGYAMTGYFAGFWRFDTCAPGEYEYQIDFNDRMTGIDNDYRELMQDTGIEIVQTWSFWVILRKKRTDEPFTLYSDAESKLTHYYKIRRMFQVAVIIELVCFFIDAFAAAGGVGFAYFGLVFLLLIIIAMIRTLARLNCAISSLKE